MRQLISFYVNIQRPVKCEKGSKERSRDVASLFLPPYFTQYLDTSPIQELIVQTVQLLCRGCSASLPSSLAGQKWLPFFTLCQTVNQDGDRENKRKWNKSRLWFPSRGVSVSLSPAWASPSATVPTVHSKPRNVMLALH